MAERIDWTPDVRRRVGALKLSPAREAEIVEELSQHLDDRMRELTDQGLDPDTARRQAIAELSEHPTLAGDFGHLRQAVFDPIDPPGRPGRGWFADLWRDIGYSFRLLMRQPGFTAAAVVTLALGIGANTAIFSLVNAALFERLPVRDRDRLAYIWNGAGRNVFSLSRLRGTSRRYKLFEGISAWGGITASLNMDGTTDTIGGVIVTGNYFDLLGVQPLMGRLLSPEDDRVPGPIPWWSSAIAWQNRFAERPDVIGREILLNGHIHHRGRDAPRVPRSGSRHGPRSLRADDDAGADAPAARRLLGRDEPRSAEESEQRLVVRARQVEARRHAGPG
jgi:putative ABC transport system permease protein